MFEDITCFPGLDHDHLPFGMGMLGISYCDGSYKIERTSSVPVTVIEYVISGQGTVETSSGIFYPSAGDSYILHAGEYHKYYSSKEDPWVKIWVNFQGYLILPILDAYGLTNSMLLPNLDTSPYLKKIHAIAAAQRQDPETMLNQCCSVFLHLCQYIKRNIPSRKPVPAIPYNILKLKKYLDQHLDEHLTLEKCSKIACLSISQTVRAFHNAYGMPPYEYINTQRIECAKLLLCNSTLSIESIAARSGFKSQQRFSQYFKQKVGVPPSIYRNDK